MHGNRKPITWEVIDGCHVLTQPKPDKRGRYLVYRTINGKNRAIHVKDLIYREIHGEIPEGARVITLCGNKGCVNPEHLTLTYKKYDTKLEWEESETGCFEVVNRQDNGKGYTTVYDGNKLVLSHRFIYAQCFGEIPDNLVVRHKCDNPRCINPEHLELGTIADNNNDMVVRGRSLKGERNHQAKLTESDVLKIREEYEKGAKLKDLSVKYGVAYNTIRQIAKRIKWVHV